MPASLSRAQARRIALAAQGFGRPRPTSVGTRQLSTMIERLKVLQVDSVNVLTRAHYLPLFSRLGPYDTALLDRLRDGSGPRARAGRTLVEYWAHEASLLPVATWPYLGFRMERARERAWSRHVVEDHAVLLAAVVDVVASQGPLTARQVEAHLPHGAARDREDWGWNWSAVKQCLEYLFWAGLVTSAGRTAQFERRYAVPAQVLPPEVVARAPGTPEAPGPLESVTELLRQAVRAHGIGTRRDLADYFRLRGPLVQEALDGLLAAGEVEEVDVPGWRGSSAVYLDPAARRPRAVRGAALLSPFDSLVWQRDRVEEIWDFRYRIEIYVPAPQRVHGYYVLPFLLDEQLVGRVDLKSDRAAGVLRVQSLGWEPGTDVARALPALQDELASMAGWLGLGRVDLPAG
ncbi:winged helix-turn-helix domain-containing protein [Ornithinimicrobium flavum]|uniref:winged helix-turn-helix domain-containing protein n=1 Tax=Ornithinimicrobium flavum TaxID=1288636 RepID=UPI00106FD99E|nr:crosslink repair DNA glycosylase YcaQ family protein [Ornithinimicrobium flavum]